MWGAQTRLTRKRVKHCGSRTPASMPGSLCMKDCVAAVRRIDRLASCAGLRDHVRPSVADEDERARGFFLSRPIGQCIRIASRYQDLELPAQIFVDLSWRDVYLSAFGAPQYLSIGRAARVWCRRSTTRGTTVSLPVHCLARAERPLLGMQPSANLQVCSAVSRLQVPSTLVLAWHPADCRGREMVPASSRHSRLRSHKHDLRLAC